MDVGSVSSPIDFRLSLLYIYVGSDDQLRAVVPGTLITGPDVSMVDLGQLLKALDAATRRLVVEKFARAIDEAEQLGQLHSTAAAEMRGRAYELRLALGEAHTLG